ncbi:MAG: hypothetical protein H6Q14_432 [Bacteroidetes bacterium]|nr:hypothetical protein [Bacteroidota bacterium]
MKDIIIPVNVSPDIMIALNESEKELKKTFSSRDCNDVISGRETNVRQSNSSVWIDTL